MIVQRAVLLSAVLAITLAEAPALAQTTGGGAATIPDFSGLWWHPSLPGIEPLDSGPTSLRNLSRRNGVGTYNQLVGDYNNPILQPWAAEVVKKKGELSKARIGFQNPANQCWPMPIPFIYKNFGLQLLQQAHQITMLYEKDHEVRRVRMNASHPAEVKPTWYGDSVGHYEGDTLVIDTIGMKIGPYAMMDLYGTPQTEKLHVIERFRLVDYEEAKEGLDRDARENQPAQTYLIDRNYRGKHLQNRFTVEDPNVFTTPWTATVTYRRGYDHWPELVCAENRGEYYLGEHSKDSEVPTATKLDF